MGLSTRQECLLQHQTGSQYSVAEWIKARVANGNMQCFGVIWNLLIVLKDQHELAAFYSMILGVDGM